MRRLIIKLGTNILRESSGDIHRARLAGIAGQVAALKGRGIEVVIVSSGAIGLGMGKLGLEKRPHKLEGLQACAAIGQTLLMQTWQGCFDAHQLTVGQVLLTREDVRGRKRHVAVMDTLQKLLSYGVVPIINENDTVSAEEIKFGDNDQLAALVACLLKADLLLILSTIPGLMNLETHEVVAVVPEITESIKSLAATTHSQTSTGGMISKLEAAEIATRAGTGVFIGSGADPAIISRLLAGQNEGTYFVPQKGTLQSRKRWIAFFERPTGIIKVDSGARKALREEGASLLAKGITGSSGNFAADEVVSIATSKGGIFARGISRFSSVELQDIYGLSSADIKKKYPGRHAEVVHRDALVLLG